MFGGGLIRYLVEGQFELFFISVIVLVIAFVAHEWGHAFAAVKMGDPGPRYDGRLSLNPAKHLEPIGFLLIVLVGFGWAKPVMTNPSRYTSKWGDLIVSSAGVIMNLILAIVSLLLLKFLPLDSLPLLSTALEIAVSLNVLLFVFNLIPIPPLDGSHILLNLLPRHMQMQWRQAMYNQSSFFLLMIVLVANSFLGNPLGKLVNGMTSLLVFLVGGI